MKCWNPASLSEDEHAGGGSAPNWCLHRRPLFSRWTFHYSGRKDGKNIKAKTQCWHWSAALWTEGEMSKQSPGAGVFWWTKLPARRLHVGQVNKAQRRWCGGFDRVRLWNLWLCFHRLAAMLICKWHGRYSRLDNFCPATPSLNFLHKRSCVIQSKHHILRKKKKKKMTGMCARNVTPNRPQKRPKSILHFFHCFPINRLQSSHSVNQY